MTLYLIGLAIAWPIAACVLHRIFDGGQGDIEAQGAAIGFGLVVAMMWPLTLPGFALWMLMRALVFERSWWYR